MKTIRFNILKFIVQWIEQTTIKHVIRFNFSITNFILILYDFLLSDIKKN